MILTGRDRDQSMSGTFTSSVADHLLSQMDQQRAEEAMDYDTEEIVQNHTNHERNDHSMTIDFAARDYQIELLEKALVKNTIVSLKTGAGKTYIAVMLIKEKQAEITKPYSEGGRRTFFLVPKVPLVYQQAKAIQDHTTLRVGTYHGEMNVDNWKLDDWNKEFEDHEVAVMTPQVLVDMLHNAYITLDKINLLIFDECHSATGDHPYCVIMSRFKNYRTLPHVLGLTASIISKKCPPQKVDTLMKDLETALHSHIETTSDCDTVSKHATKPKVIIVEFGHSSAELNDITSDIIDILQQGKRFIESIREEYKRINAAEIATIETECSDDNSSDGPVNKRPKPSPNYDWEEDIQLSERMEFGSTPIAMIKNVVNIADILGLWCAKTLCEIYLKDIPKLQQFSMEQFDECTATLFGVAEYILSDVQATLAAHFEHCSNLKSLQSFVTPKVQRLLELLAVFQPKNDACSSDSIPNTCLSSFRGIIFVELRIVAWMLTEYLQRLCEVPEALYDSFSPCYIVGHGTCGSGENKSAMKVHKQSETLRRFRKGNHNLMLATQVVEEGLDVPKCNVVIRFDRPKVYSSYVQSMGRARSEKAFFILLVSSEDMENTKNDICTFKMIEMVLQSKSHDRSLPDVQELEKFYEEHNLLPPYYTNGKDGVHVTMDSAISVLYKYCNRLPHDRFTILQPKFKCKINEENKTFLYEVDLPCSSGLQQIQGPEMRNTSQAKKAGAYEACVLLHKAGELTDDLEPVDSIERYQEQLGIVPMELSNPGESKPGTRKRQQLYDKMVALDLQSSFPKCGNNIYYIYDIIIDDESRHAHNSFFGIMSSRPINPVSPFKLFGKNCGCVRLKLVKVSHGLTDTKVAILESFHCFLFSVVLRTTSPAMIYSPEEAQWSFLIVPLKELPNNTDDDPDIIDWNLIASCATFGDNPSLEKPLLDTPLFEEGDVLITQYGEYQRRFYVLKVCTDLSPDSAFPNDKDVTYVKYYQARYSVRIQDRKQPLLLVDFAPNTLNMLLPIKNGSEVGKLNPNRLQHLVPELCRKFPLDINRLTQAMCIPSILHRLNGLLLANELSSNIGRCIGQEAALDAETPMVLPQLESCSTYKDCCVPRDNGLPPVSLANTIDSSHLKGCLFQALTTQSAANWSDLERLEFIGDSFLKYSISVFLFSQYSNLNEGILSGLRTGMIKNFTLYSHAKDKQIPDMLNYSMFQPRLSWLPPCYIIPKRLSDALVATSIPAHLWPHACLDDFYSGLATNKADWLAHLMDCWKVADPARKNRAPNQTKSKTEQHYNKYTQQLIGDKFVADSVEALIGAVLMCCGEHNAVHFVDWLGLRVHPDSFPWQPPTTALLPHVVQQVNKEMISAMYVDLEALEKKLNYTFTEKSFLRQALVHPSYTRFPATDNYQRLEFLGDAVLDYLVTVTLYEKNSNLSPGKMTDLRSALVDNVTFAYLAVKCEMHKFLRYSNSLLYQVIDRYMKHIENFTHPKDAAYMIKEEDTLVLEEIEVPKVLGDIFESIAGAIYVDSGYSLKAVWNVYYPIMKDVIEQYTVEVPISPVRMLLEEFSDATWSVPKKEEDIYIVEVVCRGKKFVGCSKKKGPAKQAAAKCALNAFEISATRSVV